MSTTHAERVERYRSHVRELIAACEISIAEYAILNHLHFGCHRLPGTLGKFAASPDYALGHRVTVREASQAVRSCLKRGLIRVMSKSDLAQIKEDLARDHLLGPIYGFPEPGQVDFTRLGAQVWLEIERSEDEAIPCRGFSYLDAVELKTRWTFLSRTAMTGHRARLRKEPHFASMTRPTVADDVRLAWWCPPMRGWSFEVTEKFHWQGRGGVDSCTTSALLNWDAEFANVDRAQLRRHCRHHDLEPSDLCVLLRIAEGGPFDVKRLGRSSLILAKSGIGLRMTIDQIVGAIRRCLHNGLIVRLNAEENQRIELAAKESSMPLYTQESRLDFLDLTDAGARFLVEQGSKILKTAWLDGWVVSRKVFSRDHLYTRNFLDIASVFERYSRFPQKSLKIGPIEEIGPWCVYWWNRFPKGYRLELEVTSE